VEPNRQLAQGSVQKENVVKSSSLAAGTVGSNAQEEPDEFLSTKDTNLDRLTEVENLVSRNKPAASLSQSLDGDPQEIYYPLDVMELLQNSDITIINDPNILSNEPHYSKILSYLSSTDTPSLLGIIVPFVDHADLFHLWPDSALSYQRTLVLPTNNGPLFLLLYATSTANTSLDSFPFAMDIVHEALRTLGWSNPVYFSYRMDALCLSLNNEYYVPFISSELRSSICHDLFSLTGGSGVAFDNEFNELDGQKTHEEQEYEVTLEVGSIESIFEDSQDNLNEKKPLIFDVYKENEAELQALETGYVDLSPKNKS